MKPPQPTPCRLLLASPNSSYTLVLGCQASQGRNTAPPIGVDRLLSFPENGFVTQRDKTQVHVPQSAFHQEVTTSLLESLIHQRADNRRKKNYNTAACGEETQSQKVR